MIFLRCIVVDRLVLAEVVLSDFNSWRFFCFFAYSFITFTEFSVSVTLNPQTRHSLLVERMIFALVGNLSSLFCPWSINHSLFSSTVVAFLLSEAEFYENGRYILRWTHVKLGRCSAATGFEILDYESLVFCRIDQFTSTRLSANVEF